MEFTTKTVSETRYEWRVKTPCTAEDLSRAYKAAFDRRRKEGCITTAENALMITTDGDSVVIYFTIRLKA